MENNMEKTLQKTLEQILVNQMTLLALSQQSNMHDHEEKAKFADAAFREYSNSRLVLEELKKAKKNG